MKERQKLQEPFLVEKIPFFGKNNLYITELGSKDIMMEFKATETHLNPMEMIHGGILFALADTAAGMFARLAGKECVTLCGNMNYLRPSYEGKVEAHGKIKHRGEKTWVIDVDIIQDEEIKAIGNFTIFNTGERKLNELSRYILDK